jgi:hypothetical protein
MSCGILVIDALICDQLMFIEYLKVLQRLVKLFDNCDFLEIELNLMLADDLQKRDRSLTTK